MNTIRLRRIYALAAAFAVSGITFSFGAAAQQGPQALPAPAQGQARVIVTVAPNASPEDVARDHGILPIYVYRAALNGFAATVSDLARAGLMADVRVRDVEADQIVTADHDVPGGVQANPPSWGLDRIDQRALPLDSSYTYSSDAHDVTAYVIDSGIRYTHVDFGGRAIFGFDAFGGDGNDCHRHGTQVSSTLGGSTYGVAKAVRLVSVRVLGCDGTGSVSGVIAGVDFVTAFHNSPAVANMSLLAGASTTLDTAVQNMIFSGVATSVAAGNDNTDACLRSPARVTNAMTIGSADSSDVKAATSSFGSCLDLFAPGVGILSATNVDDFATRLGSGTSLASPHVAGIAALYLQQHVFASPAEVRDALLRFSTKGVVSNSNTINNHLLFAAEIPDGTGDYTSPETEITSPSNGTLVQRNKTITLTAFASDNAGVARVEFYVGGVLKCTDLTAPYTCAWKVPASPRNATYVLQSRAFDAAGNGQASPFVSIMTN